MSRKFIGILSFKGIHERQCLHPTAGRDGPQRETVRVKESEKAVTVADAGPPIDGPPPCPQTGSHTFKCVNGVAGWVAD
jgi:hypothetical protein